MGNGREGASRLSCPLIHPLPHWHSGTAEEMVSLWCKGFPQGPSHTLASKEAASLLPNEATSCPSPLPSPLFPQRPGISPQDLPRQLPPLPWWAEEDASATPRPKLAGLILLGGGAGEQQSGWLIVQGSVLHCCPPQPSTTHCPELLPPLPHPTPPGPPLGKCYAAALATCLVNCSVSE